MAKKAEEIELGNEIVGRDGTTSPAPPYIEDGPKASVEHDDQVMADADDIVHGYVGGSSVGDPTGEKSEPDLAAGNGDWEITALIGKDIIDGEVHYLVQWKPTLCQSTRSTLPNWLVSLRLNMGNQKVDPYRK
jgi:hypothetical protein